MKKSATAIYAFLFLAACGGSSGNTDQASDSGFKDAKDIQNALTAAGLNCTGYAVVPKEDRELGQESAVSVGTCELDGESVQLVVWKDNGQRDNFSGLAKSIGCEFAKAFGIQSLDWVDGDKWQITGTSQTLASQVSKDFDGKARNVKC
jgi:hypothetical protein